MFSFWPGVLGDHGTIQQMPLGGLNHNAGSSLGLLAWAQPTHVLALPSGSRVHVCAPGAHCNRACMSGPPQLWHAMDAQMATGSASPNMDLLDESDAAESSNRPQCLGHVCPWCILDVDHQADISLAANAWKREHELFAHGGTNPWKFWITSCAWNWIWTMHCVQVQPPARTLADQGIWGVTTADTQSSIPPPPPPQSLLPSMDASATAAKRLLQQAADSSLAPDSSRSSSWRGHRGGSTPNIPVVHSGSHSAVEYWGGKSTGWTPYDDDVQGVLKAALAAGNLRVQVNSGGRDYIICMETMKQWRTPWQPDYNARQIRFVAGATVPCLAVSCARLTLCNMCCTALYRVLANSVQPQCQSN